jgi:hypothetical protein
VVSALHRKGARQLGSARVHGSAQSRSFAQSLGFAQRLATGLALACAAACSHAPAGSASASSQPIIESAQMHSVDSASPLVERIFEAPLHVKHGGTRHLWFAYQSEGVERTLEYVEHVTADGEGHFALDPGAIVQPAMSVQQREVFELTQKQREGFFFRYRDFGVRQRTLFEANYSVEVLGMPIVIAGRTCTQIDVHRKGKSHSKYRAAIDDETGLVLRWTESTLEGRIIASSEFTEFTLDPVLDGVDWFVSPLQVDELQMGSSAQLVAALGFQPHTPQLLPAGYQLLRAERVVADHKTWLRRVYGDGLENLFVLEGGPDAAPATEQAHQGALRAASISQNNEIVVRLCQAGAWTLAEIDGRSGQIFVVGKVGEDEVVDCLQSSF